MPRYQKAIFDLIVHHIAAYYVIMTSKERVGVGVRRGSCEFGHITSRGSLEELARQRAHLSVLLPHGSCDLQGNLSRHVARPTFVGVERAPP